MATPFVTMIMAGGVGSRMGSKEKHKVCFEVLGVPVINRALETYNLCGSSLNLIVVGTMAERVMSTVNQRFPGTAFAFQEKQLGTGDATRKGAEILERMRFDGDVLVVAGDKLIEPNIIRGLLKKHQKTGSDVTIATTKRQQDSSAGIVLKNRRGAIQKIIETSEVRRLSAIADIARQFELVDKLSASSVKTTLLKYLPENKFSSFFAKMLESITNNSKLTKRKLIAFTTEDERQGRTCVGRGHQTVEQIFGDKPQDNLSTYIFRASVLYDALHLLKPSRSGQEEYLTDVVEILSSHSKPAKITSFEVGTPTDLMAFNNPKELLMIEESMRKRSGNIKVGTPVVAKSMVAPASYWHSLVSNPSNDARKMFKKWYGNDIPWGRYSDVLDTFIQRYGPKKKAAIFRSPGRINLMGRHIDHQGGNVNVMAINREIIMVAAPRDDDVVTLSNTSTSLFSDHTFRISDVVAQLDWDDWQHAVDGVRLRRMLEAARGEWYNYVKASILRLQEQFREKRLQGMDVMVSGDIPTGAGLSSSSALVVASAEASSLFNDLGVTARRLVSLCGEGEWFVGTRGGAADHAAIKLSRRGYVTRVGFFPFRVEQSAPFPKDHDLIVCNSGVYAGKSGKARHIFNQKVTAYHIGRIYFSMMHPNLASRIEHLRDINTENLGITRTNLLMLLAQLPATMNRKEIHAIMERVTTADRDSIERLFDTHDEPSGGYNVRDVVLFGLSEMERARQCLDILRAGNADKLGHLMDISHDGDRVSHQTKGNRWTHSVHSVTAKELESMARARGSKGDLANYPGAYGCSLPQLDRIVDIARSLPGVKGAQLAGAGLGGSLMLLVAKEYTSNVIETLTAKGIDSNVYRPIAGATNLMLV